MVGYLTYNAAPLLHFSDDVVLLSLELSLYGGYDSGGGEKQQLQKAPKCVKRDIMRIFIASVFYQFFWFKCEPDRFMPVSAEPNIHRFF